MITGGQASVGTAPATLFVIPPGPCQVTVSILGAGTIFAGFGTQTVLTASNGVPVVLDQPLQVSGFQGDGGAPLRAVSGSGSVTTGWVVSSPSGGTGI